MMAEQDCLKLPFDKYDEESLEALPDEVFFAKRFVVSKDDQEIIDKNSYKVGDRVLYKANVVEPIYKKYAKITNPKPGEPGTKENPLVRFGKFYVYNNLGRLSQLVRREPQVVRFTLTSDMKPNTEQVESIRLLSGRPITSDDSCPHMTPEKLEKFRAYGEKRNQRRKALGLEQQVKA